VAHSSWDTLYIYIYKNIYIYIYIPHTYNGSSNSSYSLSFRMNNVSFTLLSGGLEYLTKLLKLTHHIQVYTGCYTII